MHGLSLWVADGWSPSQKSAICFKHVIDLDHLKKDILFRR